MDRILSVAVSLYILIVVYVVEGLSGLLVAIAVVPILCFIWFRDLLGSITGFGGFSHPLVSKESPGCFIAGIAWVFLIVIAVGFTLVLFKVRF